MKSIDAFLNSTTMYSLILLCLRIITGGTIILSLFKVIPFSLLSIIISLFVLAGTCWSTNIIFSKIFKVPANVESFAITAIILFLIISPPTTIAEGLMLVLAGVIAIASKFILVYNRTHIFNPAAFGALAVGLLGSGNVSWWVGTPMLTPILAIVGFLVVRKIRRWQLFFSFAITALIGTLIVGHPSANGVLPLLWNTIAAGTLIFFDTIMLTEPLTMPPHKKLQIIYGVIVGILFSIPFHVGNFYLTIELALIIGNLIAFAMSPRMRTTLSLISKKLLSSDIYEFDFKPSKKINFIPGQYIEWTLAHEKPDGRGNRRVFTIASSPADENIKLGIRMPSQDSKTSSFKNALTNLKVGDELVASHIGGDFVLPNNNAQKIVFIAGGIGVTPFRSMISYLLDIDEKRDITLFYVANNSQGFVYMDLFESAKEKIGLKIIKVLSGSTEVPQDWKDEQGFVTSDMIKKYIPDSSAHIFYLSGPNGMVTAYKDMLKKSGVNDSRIKTDYFPGF